MSAAFDKLRSKLAELFQLDAAAELDFGIYRILNARRVEVEAFLDSLEPQVEAILAEALQTGTSELKAELEKVEAGLRAGGFDEAMIATAPKVKELREKIATSGSDPTALTHDIFSHLTTFFSRYYKDGDFLSLRRYKRDTYAIPYEGEEVKLHWANADQYYIKSAENFRDYTFKLTPAEDAPRVTFKLVEADTQKDNTKATAGQERRFVYQGVIEPETKNEETGSKNLVLGFAYLPLGKDKKQADLNKQAIEAILKDAAKGTFLALAAPDKTYTGKKKEGRTLLEKHLTDYTARNTFDYFIHKDLGGFLRRELDFYLKNEVLHLDDLDEAPETNWRETRARLKALRTLAGKVIRFIAQIEDFQKKLWLKKKFVTACDYVVTLDRIPEGLYPPIAACEAQREEWVRLFAIDEIKADLGRTGYSVPLTVEFLKENQGLPVDTRLHAKSLLKGLHQDVGQSGMDLSGAILNTDSFHGIELMRSRYEQKLQVVYNDPPYNTDASAIIYKNGYRNSSWCSLVAGLTHGCWRLLNETGILCTTIDDEQINEIAMIIDGVFGAENRLGTVAIRSNPSGRITLRGVAQCHEYAIFSSRSDAGRMAKLPRSEEQASRFDQADKTGSFEWRNFRRDGSSSTRADRPKQFFPIYVTETTFRIPLLKWSDTKKGYDVLEEREDGEELLFPIDSQGNERCWRWGLETARAKQHELTVKRNPQGALQLYNKYRPNEEGILPLTIWTDKRYSAPEYGTAVIKSIFGERAPFDFPKSVYATQDCIHVAAIGENGTVLDCFGGSGTTGHAVINLNREDGGNRKYILIEMGKHFDTVLVPRLKKVIYSKDWKDGKPQSRNTGVSHCFKVLRLESYEDTLNNLRLHRSRAQELALESMTAEAREEYQLGYMLDLEATGSQSLLNVAAFEDPFAYTLNIATGTAGETKPVTVDLVETFNWLLGLTVLAQGSGGGVTWIEGTNPAGEKVLVLWRKTKEVDADALNVWCKKQKVSVLDGEFSLIYINGDHHLENLRRDDQTWKVRLIDEEFPKLMWEGC